MTAYIARRLDRLEERLGVSDGRPKIEFIFIHIVSPGPDGPVCEIQVAHLGQPKRSSIAAKTRRLTISRTEFASMYHVFPAAYRA